MVLVAGAVVCTGEAYALEIVMGVLVVAGED